MSRELFNDVFEVLEKDPDGKQFDKGTSSKSDVACQPYQNKRPLSYFVNDKFQFLLCITVSRLRCHSDLFGMGLMLDINTDIYPVKVLFCSL